MLATDPSIADRQSPTGNSSDWISIAEAARRSGQNEGAIRRRCGELWLASGQARLIRPHGAARSTWMVRQDADPAFGPSARAVDETPLASLPGGQRDIVMRRETILTGWQQAVAAAFQLGMGKDQATDAYLLQLQSTTGSAPSRATLYGWARKYRDAGRGGVIDGRKTKSSAGFDACKDFLDEVKRLYLRQSQPKLAACYDYARLLAEDKGWTTCSLKKAGEFIKSMDARVLIRYRLGESAFKAQVLPFMERDFTTLQSNELWCSDHMQFDVLVNAGTREEPKLVRPWLTSWQDVRSRKIMGFRVSASAPNSEKILVAFRDACLACGVPEHVYIDNGKDYDCYTLQGFTKWQRRKIRIQVDEQQTRGVFPMLGITVHHATAYNPQAKLIESWHRTVHDRFDRFQATYCGGTTDSKPEDLPQQIERGNALMLADFAQAFSNWLEADYHLNHDHSGQGMDGQTPAVVWSKCLTAKRVAPADHLELLIQRTSRSLTVGQNGITWDDRSYGKGDPLLGPWFGKKVYLRVGDDVTTVSVWTVDDRIIGRVRMNELAPYLGATDEQYRAAAREKREIRAAVAAAAELGPKRHASVAELLADRARRDAADAAKNPSPSPDSLRAIQTPFSGQEQAIERAFKRPLKIAAGAESLSHGPETIDLLAAAPEPESAQRAFPTLSLILTDKL